MTRISPKVTASPKDVRRIIELRLNPLNRVVINCSIEILILSGENFISLGISAEISGIIPKLMKYPGGAKEGAPPGNICQ